MKFKINETDEVELKYSFRINIYFEQIVGHAIDFSNFTSNDLLNLFYCTVYASLQKAQKNTITLDKFMDAIDDYNNGEKCIYEFSQWYIGVMKTEYSIENSEEVKNIKEEPSKKKN